MAGAHAIKPRWGQPMTGIVAFIVFTIIGYITWWIFADPVKGIFKLYEQPFTAWLATMIVVGVWQHIIFGDWPFQKLPPIQRGLAMTVTNLVLTWFVIYVLFEFMGNILPFWGTETLLEQKFAVMKAAGLAIPEHGTEAYEHLHHSAMDLKMASVTFWVVTGFVTYPFWAIMFQHWPFAGRLPQPYLGLAEWCVTTVVTMFVYGLLVIPHFAAVGIPAFMKSGLTPEQIATAMGKGAFTGFNPIWYAKWAPVGAQNYYWVFGLYEWIVIVLFLAANTWLGWPWNYAKTQPLRGVFGTVGMVILAWVFLRITLALLEMAWGPMEVGKAVEDAPHFRYYHAASIAGYTIMPFLMWHHYFDDIPNQPGMWNAGWWIRFFGVFALAALYGAIWYKISYPLFGLWPTLSIAAPNAYQLHELVQHGQPFNQAWQVMNKPLVWIFWWIIPLLFNEWFMHKWPFYVEEHEHAAAHH